MNNVHSFQHFLNYSEFQKYTSCFDGLTAGLVILSNYYQSKMSSVYFPPQMQPEFLQQFVLLISNSVDGTYFMHSFPVHPISQLPISSDLRCDEMSTQCPEDPLSLHWRSPHFYTGGWPDEMSQTPMATSWLKPILDTTFQCVNYSVQT